MPRSCLGWIALAFSAACAGKDPRNASPARDTATSALPVAQAGDTAEDGDGPLGISQACSGKGDTIEVTGPTIIASTPGTEKAADTTTKAAPRDSAAADSLAEEEEQEGNEADTDFVLMALGACKALHTAGITMYVNSDTTRVIHRRGAFSKMSFKEAGFVFVDTSGVRHRQEGFMGKYRILVVSDSLFGTHLSRGLEP